MRRIRLQLLLLLVVAPALLDAKEGEQVLRIATYNTRNYLCMDRRVEDQFRVEYPKPEVEKDVLRRSIHAVKPDILALQEVGSEAMLLELRDDLAREGLQYEGYALLEAADSVRRVAALWRGDLRVTAVGHDDLDFPLFDQRLLVKRGMLQLEVVAGEAPPFSVFILHLKSKYTIDERDPQSEERRTREAEAARDRILELYPDPAASRFLVVGDLNDGPNSRALERFYQRGDLEIARALECRDPDGLIWTHFYQKGGQYAQIDYILMSMGWLDEVSAECEILGLEDYYQGSDHRLVWADVPLFN